MEQRAQYKSYERTAEKADQELYQTASQNHYSEKYYKHIYKIYNKIIEMEIYK